MTTTLRLVLDQMVAPTDPDLATASRELARALVTTAPRGCEVVAAIPAAGEDAAAHVHSIEGLAGVESSRVPRRELSSALSLGLPSGLGAGMLHSPTLFAPLVRHDRVHNHDQTVVTIWDLTPWTHPERHPKATVAWHRAMLKRAERHADAVVVPLHAMAAELAERTRLAGRIRVIAGAAPDGFAEPRDAVGRRRTLGVPEGAVVVDAAGVSVEELRATVSALARAVPDRAVVAVGAASEDAGLPASVIVLGAVDGPDRAATLAAASVVLAPSSAPVYAWRALEALALGRPMLAADSAGHRELIGEGGTLVDGGASALADAAAALLAAEDAQRRAATLAADRGRAFSWREAADRVWQLHADL